jgi:hypothetical protein
LTVQPRLSPGEDGVFDDGLGKAERIIGSA